MNKWRPLLERLASVRLTLFCIAFLMVLVLFGTLAQVQIGTFAAQKMYFNSFWIYKDILGMDVPVLPGGLTVGAVWMVNLLAAFAVRFDYERKHLGILLSHFGLIVLFGGQFLAQTLGRESQMPIEIGQSSNFSESFRDMELAVSGDVDSDIDEVTVIPERALRREGRIEIPRQPYFLNIKKYIRNAQVGMGAPGTHSMATRGIGLQVSVQEADPVSSDDEINNVSAFVEVLEGERSLGTWLVSFGLGAPQSFDLGGKKYRLMMRLARRYYPFTLTLKEFHHDIYPGTDIPKNFSSLVRLTDPEKNESRDALIYMNNPLRYAGHTFYQASFGKNDTLSVFQVVKNPAWLTPYISCFLVVLGLGIRFFGHLSSFARRPS
ncbi:MAG: hypothetical protein A3A86_03225 [Elusimicrobia bacterium RIFCSPLOWO2_01_FULL_60_11]|nr:MAG: hypothetical protein A3A86_03225 [Elusimicrobia bacterium RIFCSPLOWO2_01_FULL_60_11]